MLTPGDLITDSTGITAEKPLGLSPPDLVVKTFGQYQQNRREHGQSPPRNTRIQAAQSLQRKTSLK